MVARVRGLGTYILDLGIAGGRPVLPLHAQIRRALGQHAEGTAPVEATCACRDVGTLTQYRRLHLSFVLGLVWLSGSSKVGAQPGAHCLRGGRATGYSERAVPRLPTGFSSAPTISMTQIGPLYGRRNSLRSPSLGGAIWISKHAALKTPSRSTRPDSCIFVLVRAPGPSI